jgi:O-acetyl-ADP-ribose deacetylase (regulator of RNase III)
MRTQKLILVDNKAELAEAWTEHFSDLIDKGHVEVHGKVDIMSFEGDAVVSPANSFGFMDGGVDLIYSLNMGWEVMYMLQATIRSKYEGELLVGQHTIIPTGYGRYPNLLVVPTMREPKKLIGTDNVYLASKALFLAMRKNPELRTVVCPGLGTGTGGISPSECARIMRMAYNDWYLGDAVENGTLAPRNLLEVFDMCAKHKSYGREENCN